MNFLAWIQKRTKDRKWGKSDWLILILLGVLLMVVVWPTGSDDSDSDSISSDASNNITTSSDGTSAASLNQTTDSLHDNSTDEWKSTYAAYLEEELEDLLTAMDGVGEVRVMITLKDDGETILDKDTSRSSDSSSESTVIFEQDDDDFPYITSQIFPSVQGVVVVAEGAGTGSVSADITEMVVALFGIESHKVKVVKMG